MTINKEETASFTTYFASCTALMLMLWTPLAMMELNAESAVETRYPLTVLTVLLLSVITWGTYNCCSVAWASYGSRIQHVITDVLKLTTIAMSAVGLFGLAVIEDIFLIYFMLFTAALFGVASLLLSVTWVFNNVQSTNTTSVRR